MNLCLKKKKQHRVLTLSDIFFLHFLLHLHYYYHHYHIGVFFYVTKPTF